MPLMMIGGTTEDPMPGWTLTGRTSSTPATGGEATDIDTTPSFLPSFMDGPGKYVVFGGLGLVALWYFKLRKKAV